MLFEKYLLPDEMLDTFDKLTPEHVISLGKRFIYSDIDNTLATYDDTYPPESVKTWYDSMRKNGITVTFVSNNNKDRVDTFNSKIGAKAYAKAGKPSARVLREAMAKDGATAENSLLLGDQLLTDNAAAKTVGMYSVIVPPIKDKKNLFFKTKRLIEVPYIKKFKKINK